MRVLIRETRQRRWCEGRSRGQGDAATAKEGGQPLGGERSRGMGPPLQAPKGTQPCGPLHFSLCNWLWTFDLQNYKRINVCCFKSQSLCYFITVATGSYYIPQWCLLWHKWQGKPDGTQLQYLPRNPRVRHLLNQLDRIAPFVLHVEICWLMPVVMQSRCSAHIQGVDGWRRLSQCEGEKCFPVNVFGDVLSPTRPVSTSEDDYLPQSEKCKSCLSHGSEAV